MNQMQQTLKQKIVFTGKGLHTGRIVRMEVHPAAENFGIQFQRTDTDVSKPLAAVAQNISSTELCTTIGTGSSSVGTIEHLMAAFFGMGIDNALVKLNAPEVPIMDGSAWPFVEAFKKMGLKTQNLCQRLFIVKEAFEFSVDGKFIRMEPAKNLSFEFGIDFGNSFIGKQQLTFHQSRSQFLKLADARTFCHVNEVNALRRMGLAQGGSLENAVVVSDSGVMNEEGLRGDNEFVRHKLLDCLGDLYLMGGRLVGKFTVAKSGHGFHADFMKKVLQDQHRYFTVVEPAQFNPNLESEKKLAMAGGVVYG